MITRTHLLPKNYFEETDYDCPLFSGCDLTESLSFCKKIIKNINYDAICTPTNTRVFSVDKFCDKTTCYQTKYQQCEKGDEVNHLPLGQSDCYRKTAVLEIRPRSFVEFNEIHPKFAMAISAIVGLGLLYIAKIFYDLCQQTTESENGTQLTSNQSDPLLNENEFPEPDLNEEPLSTLSLERDLTSSAFFSRV